MDKLCGLGSLSGNFFPPNKSQAGGAELLEPKRLGPLAVHSFPKISLLAEETPSGFSYTGGFPKRFLFGIGSANLLGAKSEPAAGYILSTTWG